MITVFSGSPLPGRTNSHALARYLAARLPDRPPVREIGDGDDQEQVIRDLAAGTTLVVVSPVFLDGPPAQLLAWMARSADHLGPGPHPSRVLALVHSGYPEEAHREVSVEAWRAWARESGVAWGGALGFGGTSPIGGKDLEEVPLFTRHIQRTLASLASDLSGSTGVFSEATHAACRRHGLPLPRWLVPTVLNLMGRRTPGALPGARPYAPAG